jgi:hypothetical protein
MIATIANGAQVRRTIVGNSRTRNRYDATMVAKTGNVCIAVLHVSTDDGAAAVVRSPPRRT